VAKETWRRRPLSRRRPPLIRDYGALRATVEAWLKSITQLELRNASGEIMRRLDRGEPFIVT
jgi:hypothetical protein